MPTAATNNDEPASLPIIPGQVKSRSTMWYSMTLVAGRESHSEID